MAVGATEKLVCFRVGGDELALPIGAVKETIAARPVTRLPLVPEVVLGLINLRGEVVAVLDLEALCLPRKEPRHAPAASMVLLRATQPSRAAHPAAAIAVDQLTGVRDVALEAIYPPPPSLPASLSYFLIGVATVDDDTTGPRPVSILDAARILAAEAIRPFAHSDPERDVERR